MGGVVASGGVTLRIPPEDLTRVAVGVAILFWSQEKRALLNAPNYIQLTRAVSVNQKTVGGGKIIIGSDFMAGLTVLAPPAVN
jgi:hypothetical protein